MILKNPGPGSYNINRNLGKIGYIFGLKTNFNQGTNKYNPGPGTYSLRGSFMNIPGSKMGTSTRDDEINK